jgi:hypothetical protein
MTPRMAAVIDHGSPQGGSGPVAPHTRPPPISTSASYTFGRSSAGPVATAGNDISAVQSF